MHVETIKEVVRILTGNGETNKEFQSCLLGYVVGLEAPIGLNTELADDKVEWTSFFNDIPGEINEHFLLNLSLAQEVADLTLKYRQAVMNGDDTIEQLAKRFLTLTGSAFGLLGKDGTVKLIRKVLRESVQQSRTAMEHRMEIRRLKAEERTSIANEGFWDSVKTMVDILVTPKYEFKINPLEVGKFGVNIQVLAGKYHNAKNIEQFAYGLLDDLVINKNVNLSEVQSENVRRPSEAEVPATNLNQVAVSLLRSEVPKWKKGRGLGR